MDISNGTMRSPADTLIDALRLAMPVLTADEIYRLTRVYRRIFISRAASRRVGRWPEVPSGN